MTGTELDAVRKAKQAVLAAVPAPHRERISVATGTVGGRWAVIVGVVGEVPAGLPAAVGDIPVIVETRSPARKLGA